MYAWPCVVLTAILGFMLLFRKDISGILLRIRTISIPKIASFATGEDQIAEARKTGAGGTLLEAPAKSNGGENTKRSNYDEAQETFQNPMVLEQARLLEGYLGKLALESKEREQLLLKTLATSQIALQFEKTYRIIYGSQIESLRFLARQSAPLLEVNVLSSFYDQSVLRGLKAENWTFDNWLGFLETSLLVQRQGILIGLTVRGREFLKYLIDERLPDKGL